MVATCYYWDGGARIYFLCFNEFATFQIWFCQNDYKFLFEHGPTLSLFISSMNSITLFISSTFLSCYFFLSFSYINYSPSLMKKKIIHVANPLKARRSYYQCFIERVYWLLRILPICALLLYRTTNFLRTSISSNLLNGVTDISTIDNNTVRGDESEKTRCRAVDVAPSSPSGSKGQDQTI